MSHVIYIEHNPFTISTKFEINGLEPDNISFLENNRNRKLQLWIEQLFPHLYEIFNGSNYFDVTFKGVEADFLDVEEAVNKAKEDGIIISLNFIQVADGNLRLSKIQELMEEVKSHPIFEDKFKTNNSQIDRNFKAAFNKDFDVYVAATMSAGKSTLINSMLGYDLLPAANEATTATIAQITDNDSMPLGQFNGRRINKNDEEVDGLQIISLNTLKEWNAKPDTKLIHIEGNIIGIKERENVRLVLTDTPGPNNSQDPEHSRTTMSYIQDSLRNPLILYILNATQLGTNDDKFVLSEIAQIMKKGGKQSKDRFIFIVNKMDQFDPESGENIKEALERVTAYLQANGIDNPLIYPVSANFTRLLRKEQDFPDSLTRKERADVSGMKDLFAEEPSMNLLQYMSLTSSVRRNLKEKKNSNLLNASGIPAIEAMIDEYIDKYNLPNRVNRAYQALNEAIIISSNESELILNLENHQKDFENIESQLRVLIENKEASSKAKEKMEMVINDRKSLYNEESLRKFDTEEAEIRTFIRELNNNFTSLNDKSNIQKIEIKLQELEQEVTSLSNKLINKLDMIISESQGITRDKLTEIFEKYVKDIFKDLDIPLPILKGLTDQISSISKSTTLGLEDDEINKEEVYKQVGTKTVSASRWYNPFSWGDTKEIAVYGYVTEETVDLDEVWQSREFKINVYFNELVNDARKKLEEDTKTYAKSFTDFMGEEFKVKFDEILTDFNAKIKDKSKIQSQIDEAKLKLDQINEFKDKLNNILDL